MKMPKYSDPSGVAGILPIKPPFYFDHMTCHVFPLRSSLNALQGFVDSYLNIIPEELGRFRAFMPYVHLMLVDYGKLALRCENLGWLSQQEIMFAVPVEWYQVVDGRWEFKDWAWVSPFIFVDSELSLTLGRTV